MELIIKNRNGKVSERQRAHIQDKLSKLERFLDHDSTITLEISSEKRRNQRSEVQRLQATLIGEHGVILRAEESSDDLYRAIDEVQSVLQRQIKRYKEKHWRRGKMRRKSGEFVPSEAVITPPENSVLVKDEAEESDAEAPRIVRVKEFGLKPMFTDEAVEQMELLNHSFFLFRDADTSHVSLIYRRKDGNYGLIVPEEIA